MHNKVINPTFGTDPEFMIELNGKPVCVIEKIPGNKKEPYLLKNGICVQPDGVMIEGTQPPCYTKEEFLNYLDDMKGQFQELLNNINPELQLVCKSSGHYSGQLNHPETMRFGCDASYCVYTGDVSPRPQPEDIGDLRTAGFHIHVGTENRLNIENIENFIKCMDLFVGIPSIVLDDDKERRNLYGNAGDFRFKFEPVTIMEYRVLGGYMINHADFVFEQTLKAIEFYNNMFFVDFDFVNVKNIIDNDDYEGATKLLNTIGCENLLKKHTMQVV